MRHFVCSVSSNSTAKEVVMKARHLQRRLKKLQVKLSGGTCSFYTH
jgi:hypothetical protein